MSYRCDKCGEHNIDTITTACPNGCERRGYDLESVTEITADMIHPGGIVPTLRPCPSCGVGSGEWCRRHGQTMPGVLLCCPDRVRLARGEK